AGRAGRKHDRRAHGRRSGRGGRRCPVQRSTGAFYRFRRTRAANGFRAAYARPCPAVDRQNNENAGAVPAAGNRFAVRYRYRMEKRILIMAAQNPRFLVITGDGINCERETAAALRLAGAAADILHINDLVAAPENMARYDGLALPGGFS